MKDFPIPVRSIGPGSQPGEDAELDYIDMPRGMNTFQMPRVPEKADTAALTQARDVLARYLAALEKWNPDLEAHGPVAEMAGVSPAALVITNQMLGEGEVGIQITGARRISIQESVFTGLWRCCEVDAQGLLLRDWLEAAAVPQIVIDAARAGAAPKLAEVECPPGAMNSPALIAEISSQLLERQPGARAHQINLTLFPMTTDDHALLERALPVGPVAMMSRGFGNCRVTSTLTRDVWRVQYFNAMNTLILNTIEVVEMPEVALASTEDLADTRERLAELIDWMGETIADQTAS
jgi:hydrogenase-1 operon protein HyaF